MNYSISPAICSRAENSSLRLASSMAVRKGDPDLSPVATQWTLETQIKVNGTKASFDLVENLLRSFLASKFSMESSSKSYEQISSGFIVKCATPYKYEFEKTKRREVEKVTVLMDFAHKTNYSSENLFPELLALSDFCFTTLIQTLSTIAPLVFNQYSQKKLERTIPLMRSIKAALDLPKKSLVLEKMADRSLRSETKPRCARTSSSPETTLDVGMKNVDPTLMHAPADGGILTSGVVNDQWQSPGVYYAQKVYEYRKFVVLTDDGDCIHEPVFFQ